MKSNWDNILVSPTDSIQDVLQVIDKQGLQLALVVDTNKLLLGTITDGDVRRALIKGKPLSSPAANIMFSCPTTLSPGASSEEITSILNEKGLLSIPVLKNGRVVGLETRYPINSKRVLKNPVVLMAGGFGTRLKPLTDICPKPMLKVGGVPILEILLSSFISAGFSEFYISIHYMAEVITEYFQDGSKWGIDITYLHEATPLGTGGALGLMPELSNSLPLIVMNCDVLTNVNLCQLLDFHCDNKADITMCVQKYDYQIPYGVVEVEVSKVIGMVEKPVHKFFVNAGIYVINQEVLEHIEANTQFDLPTLIENQMHNKKNIIVFPIHEYWLDIGRMDDFNRAQVDIHNLHLIHDK